MTSNDHNVFRICSGVCLMNNSCTANDTLESEKHIMVACESYNHLRQETFNKIIPITNNNIDYNDFMNYIDILTFSSYNTINDMCGIDFNAYKKFNYEMKMLLNNMLDLRRKRMIELTERGERADILIPNL